MSAGDWVACLIVVVLWGGYPAWIAWDVAMERLGELLVVPAMDEEEA